MSSTFTINNEGVGSSPFLSMHIDQTENLGFTQTDVDNNTLACGVSGNNEVGKGSAGDKLFGKILWVSPEKAEGTTVPAYGVIQARGVARFIYTTPAPELNGMVELAGGGKVRQASADADIAAGGHLMRGQVIALDSTNNTVDVWLG